ncbi:hypothetical protein [Marinomonas primoryensis]|jgi:hypothetical protein|uniref:hypothetical protein n=1 Tax=Marinomonas primoryensis TaxID=178399 RepID=UPI0030DDCB51
MAARHVARVEPASSADTSHATLILVADSANWSSWLFSMPDCPAAVTMSAMPSYFLAMALLIRQHIVSIKQTDDALFTLISTL